MQPWLPELAMKFSLCVFDLYVGSFVMKHDDSMTSCSQSMPSMRVKAKEREFQGCIQ